ncbi:hypothetical protein QVN03_19825 [Raoultella terrigena]|jgi:hypothetical protein|uniref:hypothetical protein n=1 Tax=Raoultella terrigena TaxID=577 RepID=UPI0025B24F08|nr:hypothetical protein [Raoultella terrigena]MEB8194382.1 hypothetical protein [Raoultella terrigena]WJV37620.1 hypothetical protein QVN03_19825 [Raoultella terrigena]
MSGIRELSLNEIAMVSGGEGHGSEVAQDKRDAKNNASRNNPARNSNVPNYIYGSSSNCVDNMLIGAAGGAVLGGFPGAVVGAANGAYIGQCYPGSSNSSSNGSNAGSNNCSGNSAAGTCNR